MIDGVIITPLKKIDDDRGSVLHSEKHSKSFKSFDEIYFSIAYPKAIRLGIYIKKHLNCTINGTIKLVI